MCQNLSILWQQSERKPVVCDVLRSKGKVVPANVGTKWRSVVTTWSNRFTPHQRTPAFIE